MNLAVLISGNGTNFQAIASSIASGYLSPAKIVTVISNVPSAPGLQKAKDLGLPTHVVDLPTSERDEAIIRILDNSETDLVILA